MTTAETEGASTAGYVGARVHQLLWERRITQTSAAKTLGVTQSTFSKKIRGHVGITLDELVTLARLLGVEPGDLLPRLDSNQQPSGYPLSQVSSPLAEVVYLAQWQRRAS